MTLPINPKIGDRFIHKDNQTYEYVQRGAWVVVDSESYVVIKRRQNYPEIGDQLDMLYHEIKETGSISAGGEWITAIDNVKNTYPKPQESQ
jgi:hypothetical protein